MTDNEQISFLKQVVEKNPYTFHILIKNRFPEIYDFIFSRTSFLPKNYKISYRIYCVLNGISKPPTCKNTLNKQHLVPPNKCDIHGQQLYCSTKCSNSDPDKIEKTEKIFLEKYNETTPLKVKKCRYMGEKTKQLKYCNKNFVNPKKSQETKKRKQIENPNYINEINQKIKETKRILYGNENAYCFGSQEYIDNLINKYGFYYTNREQFKETIKNFSDEEKQIIKEKREQTCLDKYQNKCSLQNENVRLKGKETCLLTYGNVNYNNREHAKITCLRKYGVDSYTKTQEFKDLWKDNKFVKNFSSKQVETKRKNHSFNISKQEETCYQLLKEKFPNIIRQYTSEVYPFNCDFYIPEIDTYIEFQGNWTHNSHPFNKNNKEDLELVNIWREKGTKFYQNAINVWTRRDVLKRETAKRNNLNFIEFWNLDEVKEWILNYDK